MSCLNLLYKELVADEGFELSRGFLHSGLEGRRHRPLGDFRKWYCKTCIYRKQPVLALAKACFTLYVKVYGLIYLE